MKISVKMIIRFVFFLVVLVSNNQTIASNQNITPYDAKPKAKADDCSVIVLESEITSKPGLPDETITYEVRVKNISDQKQIVQIKLENDDWVVMSADIFPKELNLKAGQSAQCTLKVKVVDNVALGGYEIQRIIATPNDYCKPEKLEFTTVRFRPHPYLLTTNKLINQARDKAVKFVWARENLKKLEIFAVAWKPPSAKVRQISRGKHKWVGLFTRGSSAEAWKVALAWKITSKQKYLSKALTFLRNVCSPQAGYPSTRWATDSNAYVHEGEFFTFLPAVYDLVYNEPELTKQDHQDIQDTLRLYLKTCESWHETGDISNWVVTANAGAICASLALQDMASLDRFIYGKKGFAEQLSVGVMGDGWWIEGASNYSYLVAQYYGYAAQACKNWGINLFDMRLPAKYPRGTGGQRWKNGYLGMSWDIWGSPGQSYRGLRDLYNGAIPLMNEQGVVIANNDSKEMKPGGVYELAYHHYRDSTYAWAISKNNRDDWQSLLYGEGQLSEVEDPRTCSAHVDNVGIAALRSQTPGRTPAEQIQAYLKWGTHGGWHGHFDRTDFLAMHRYGKSFYGSIAGWFGYASPLYKSWVQPSISHNMVIVDGLQQEPVESDLLLFYTGKAIQACAVQTNARWIQKPHWDPKDPNPSTKKNMIDYGSAEPVLQRRLMLVMDDYIVLADFLKGEQIHTYDWLIHPVGFIGMDAESKKFIKYTERALDDTESSYYYITDCNWYEVESPLISRFQDEILKMDIRTLWPEKFDTMLGTFPMPMARIKYEITGDGKDLGSRLFYANNFSVHKIDVPLEGIKELALCVFPKTHTKTKKKVLALGNPKFITADNKIIYLADIEFDVNNIEGGKVTGRDYYGGDIEMIGLKYEKGIMFEPSGEKGTIVVDISKLNAIRFQADFIVDSVVEDRNQTRKTLLVRGKSKRLRFLTVIEPYKDQSMIKNAVASGPDKLTVELSDGRFQSIEIMGFEGDGCNIKVTMTETKDAKILRTEMAVSQ